MTSILFAQHPIFIVQLESFIQHHPVDVGIVIRRRAIAIFGAEMIDNPVLLHATERNANGNMVGKSNAKIHATKIERRNA